MKNLHVLPTNKKPIKGDLLLRHIWKNDPKLECISWWRYNDTIVIDDVLQYTTLNGSFRDIASSFKTQHIYITSDEGVKERDWCLNEDDFDKHLLFKADSLFFDTGLEAKKIILTTDQDLIKDGVQAIDDEFLEWFVKNPSCESVKVDNWISPAKKKRYYAIDILREEAKQKKDNFALDFVCWLMDNCELITDKETAENVLWRYESEDYTVEGLFEIFVEEDYNE